MENHTEMYKKLASLWQDIWICEVMLHNLEFNMYNRKLKLMNQIFIILFFWCFFNTNVSENDFETYWVTFFLLYCKKKKKYDVNKTWGQNKNNMNTPRL